MVTLAGAELPFASLTTSEKTSAEAGEPKGTVGAVKVGFAVAAPASVTAVPDACDQAKVSGSAELLALPSSVTSAPEATVWSGPALATGSGLSGLTVMVTVEGAELRFASVTTSAKTRAPAGCPAGMVGAVKLGFTVFAPSSVTKAPDTCVQAKEMGRPAGSLLALPSSVTCAPDSTVWFGPALAMGARGGGGSGSTVMVTLDGDELAFASRTTSVKVRLAAGRPGAIAGAVKVGFADAAWESVTAGPDACDQAKVSGRPAGSLLPLPSSVTSAPDATR